MDELLLIAHRGVVTDTLTENSLGSLRETIRRGYTHVEVDLRMTKDGKIVCLHDHSLKRTTGVTGFIDRVTLKELHEKVSPEIVPSLELFCETIKGRIDLMPDVKRIQRGGEAAFAGAIEGTLSHFGLLDRALFIGDKSIHDHIKSVTRVSIGADVDEARRRVEADKDFADTHFVFAHAKDFNAGNVKAFHGLAFSVIVSINTFHYPEAVALEKGLQDVKAMIALGVDGLQIDSVYDKEAGL